MAVVVTATAVSHSRGNGAHGRGIPVHCPPLVTPPLRLGAVARAYWGVQDAFSAVRGGYAGAGSGQT